MISGKLYFLTGAKEQTDSMKIGEDCQRKLNLTEN